MRLGARFDQLFASFDFDTAATKHFKLVFRLRIDRRFGTKAEFTVDVLTFNLLSLLKTFVKGLQHFDRFSLWACFTKNRKLVAPS